MRSWPLSDVAAINISCRHVSFYHAVRFGVVPLTPCSPLVVPPPSALLVVLSTGIEPAVTTAPPMAVVAVATRGVAVLVGRPSAWPVSGVGARPPSAVLGRERFLGCVEVQQRLVRYCAVYILHL